MARRQYAPVLVSFDPGFEGADGDGSEDGEGVDNAQAEDPDATEWGDVTSQTLWITSDVPEPLNGQVDLQVVHLTDGRVLHEETVELDLDPNASEGAR